MVHLAALVVSAVRIENHPNGRRLWLFGVRWHHWTAGALLLATGARLIWRDRADLPLIERTP